ncbi:tRNA (5-methylaminomethyl-2-thiouridine)(34)-methyltransferase MnmD [Dyadobacter chenwenxiniae]|uniref:tRNA (5-methylaminomethyl-2-thiouridine)(34)-methyltransferase MnmD n=1 Tax=Dyadobacter chenwenxiniae TaxID=2906456 RepID=A0A9X1PM93_9BACT|nr:tRNA (5-methylaminomethyl-2-thiouridine)(34)-methyltransferase MnmD [Dyadobacter chenwenxiniae]MCF0062148.1 tRNA (5-methylaminomethyl-2-thiouridine)(34)-methyltransferase MnmD [Dyadobacter chenwenxiniae]UON81952.1 tRNA (5-methylaminomethyl-2-thiouridine)(34)-methyltransferase MnmD [Dyadobacter chenwenxiniae]
MERLIVTEDGSHSLYSPQYNQQYHSLQGALIEAEHIYINLGLRPVLSEAASTVRVFEMGFGTGLNAFLTWKLADLLKKSIDYVAVEAFPVSRDEAFSLNYAALTGQSGFMELHDCHWSVDCDISENFKLRKEHLKLQDFKSTENFDVIYYDAFDPRAQPELWTAEMFSQIAAQTRPGGVLTTYSSKGIVKRALRAAGFEVQRHKGPGRKTHVLKAIKI